MSTNLGFLSCRWPLVATVALLTVAVGCAEVTPPAGSECNTADDCPNGTCEGGACVSASDAGDDAPVDAVPETGTDITPLSDINREPDLTPRCDEFPEPCSANGDCCSDFCIDSDDGRVCTERCIDDDDCSGEGWECRLLNGSPPDVVRLCVPLTNILCEPCTNHTQCGGLNDFCLEQDDGRFCTADCSESGMCPEGFVCNPLTVAGAGPEGGDLETEQCEPIAGVCGDRPLNCQGSLANCDGLLETGCETDLNDLETCGTSCETMTSCVDDDTCTLDICDDGVCDNPTYCEGTPTDCGCESCSDCTSDDGWYDIGDTYACCDGSSLCATCQDQEYRSYGCTGTGCTYDVTDSQTLMDDCTPCGDEDTCTVDLCEDGACASASICEGNDTSCGCDTCEDCTSDDGWYDVGSTYACCDASFRCVCQDREYRAYSCDDTDCTFAVTETEVARSGCEACSDSDACTEDLCTAGACTFPARCAGNATSCGCTTCTNCDALDGWYDIGAGYTCCSGTSSCASCQDEEFRDYTCSGTSCTYTVTANNTATSGCTVCNDSNSCTQNQCVGAGVCSYPNNCSGTPSSCGCTTCTDCTDQNGWYNVGSTYSCCNGTQDCSSCQDREFRSFACAGTSCTYSVTNTDTQRSGCSNCNDGNSCTQNLCTGNGVCSYPGFCSGTSSSCGCTGCTNCNGLPHVASGNCSGTSCGINSCDSGWAHCDASISNGCERQLSGHTNSAPGEGLGSWAGDRREDLLLGCPTQNCQLRQTRSGTRGRWFNAGANEDSSCCAYVALTYELDVPAGADYDLHISGACACIWWSGTQWINGCSAMRGTGGDEFVVAWCNDDCGGADDDFNSNIEVRYVGGSTCSSWVLDVYSRDCYP